MSTTTLGATFDATITSSSGGQVLREDRVTEKTHPPKSGEAGRSSRFVHHTRVALPSRANRPIHVSITNRGDQTMSLGSPLVMKRVVGREPRQALLAVFDAVPFHFMAPCCGAAPMTKKPIG